MDHIAFSVDEHSDPVDPEVFGYGTALRDDLDIDGGVVLENDVPCLLAGNAHKLRPLSLFIFHSGFIILMDLAC